MIRKCTVCGEAIPPGTRYSVRIVCSDECRHERNKEHQRKCKERWRKNNPELSRQRASEFYHGKSDAINEKRRQHRLDYIEAYRAHDRQRWTERNRKEIHRQWYHNNLEHVRERDRKRSKKPERREWSRANRAKLADMINARIRHRRKEDDAWRVYTNAHARANRAKDPEKWRKYYRDRYWREPEKARAESKRTNDKLNEALRLVRRLERFGLDALTTVDELPWKLTGKKRGVVRAYHAEKREAFELCKELEKLGLGAIL